MTAKLELTEAEIRRLYYQKANTRALRKLKENHRREFTTAREKYLQEYVDRHTELKGQGIVQ